MKNIVKSFKRGYNRPTTLPAWKLIIIYFFWIISFLGYILSPIISLRLLPVGVVFQLLSLYLPIKWDTGNWRNTEKGRKYLNNYGE